MHKFKVTISGSFNRNISEIIESVYEFNDRGAEVLSPRDPRIVDSVGDFLFVASDSHRSIKLVQDRHFASIVNSDFLWLVAPNGYVGQSASMELGFAVAYGVPIYCKTLPPNLTFRRYITSVGNISKTIKYHSKLVQDRTTKVPRSTLLVDPKSTVLTAQQELEIISDLLSNYSKKGSNSVNTRVQNGVQKLRGIINLP